MIATLLFMLPGQDITAARFFPLVSGNHWTYEDSDAPGSVFETIVKDEVKPSKEVLEDGTVDVPVAYFPLEQRTDGKVRAVICYHENESTLYHVGNGPNKPVTPRAVMVASRKPMDWEFYGDNVNPYAPEPVHYTAHSELGKTENVLGSPHQTLIVTFQETLGPKKGGLSIKQVWKYAADLGLYEIDEDGTVGKSQIHHVQKLVKFEPGEAPKT